MSPIYYYIQEDIIQHVEGFEHVASLLVIGASLLFINPWQVLVGKLQIL